MYKWFSSMYMVSVGLGVAGYVLFFMLGLLETAGAGQQLRAVWPSLNSMCVMLLWYGLYFGVLGRDCAEVAADRMVGELHPPCRLSLPKGCLNTTFTSSILVAYLSLPPSLQPTLLTKPALHSDRMVQELQSARHSSRPEAFQLVTKSPTCITVVSACSAVKSSRLASKKGKSGTGGTEASTA